MNEPLNKNQGLLEKNEGLSTADIAHATDKDNERRTSMIESRESRIAVAKPQEQSAPLFAPNEAQEFRSQWDHIQTGFVDEPRKSVEEADSLVAGVIQRLAEVFAEERSKLETQWDRGDNISTEDLRLTLQRYRSFFTRLLSV